jgi:DNA-binding GntR family transcriptional regulator
MKKGGIAWEGRIVAALHQLKNIGSSARRFTVPWGTLEFDKAHKEFHTALISACGSARLIGLHQALHDQNYRYRLVLKPSPRKKSESDKDHEHIAQLVLARDFDGAAAALHAHIDLTLFSMNKQLLEMAGQQS